MKLQVYRKTSKSSQSSSDAHAFFAVKRLHCKASTSYTGAKFMPVRRISKLEMTVAFDPAGGTVQLANKTGFVGEKIGVLPEASYPGKSFTGWFNINGDLVTADSLISAENSILQAHWS